MSKEGDERAAQGGAGNVGAEFVDDQVAPTERAGEKKIDLGRRKMKCWTGRQRYSEQRHRKHADRHERADLRA